jgi:ribosomal protein L29
MKTKTKSVANQVTNKYTDCANQATDNYTDCASQRSTSIPIKEVEKMIQREVDRIKAKSTIYDDRNDLLNELAQSEMTLEHYEQCVHNATLNIQEIKKSIAQINTAIRRELELNR